MDMRTMLPVFNSTKLYKRLNTGTEEIPPPEDVNGHMLPFTLLGDDIFALKSFLMKPYPGQYLSEHKRVFIIGYLGLGVFWRYVHAGGYLRARFMANLT